MVLAGVQGRVRVKGGRRVRDLLFVLCNLRKILEGCKGDIGKGLREGTFYIKKKTAILCHRFICVCFFNFWVGKNRR